MPNQHIPIQLKRLNPAATMPAYAHPGDAGLDLYSCEEIELKPGERAGVGIGWAIEFPHGYVARILGRSGLALKHGLTGAMAGVIDPGYRGEWKVIIVNLGHEPYRITVGERIAQAIFVPVVFADMTEVTELSDSARGAGGFGSTGTH